MEHLQVFQARQRQLRCQLVVVAVEFLDVGEVLDAREVGNAHAADVDGLHGFDLRGAEDAVVVAVVASYEAAEDVVGEDRCVDAHDKQVQAGILYRPAFIRGSDGIRLGVGVSLVGFGIGGDKCQRAGAHGGQAVDEVGHVRALDFVAIARDFCQRRVLRHAELRELVVVAIQSCQLRVLRQVNRCELVVGDVQKGGSREVLNAFQVGNALSLYIDEFLRRLRGAEGAVAVGVAVVDHPLAEDVVGEVGGVDGNLRPHAGARSCHHEQDECNE